MLTSSDRFRFLPEATARGAAKVAGVGKDWAACTEADVDAT